MHKVVLHDKSFRISISATEINAAVEAVARKINTELQGKKPLFLSVLNGSFMFASDLMKKITIDCEISFVKVASYSGTASSGQPKSLIGLNEIVEGRTVVVLEDIIDSGATIDYVLHQLSTQKAADIKVACLLFKRHALRKPVTPDYVGVEVTNEFLVGYGLDYSGLGRNLPDIYVLDEYHS